MVSPELLRRYRLFGGLTAEELAGVAMITREACFADKAVIFSDGNPATHVYMLESGVVELVHHIVVDDRTVPVQVGSIPPGEPFGWSAFVEPYRLTATAQCKGPVKAIVIEAAELRAMSEANCHLGYTIMKKIAGVLAERLSYSRVQLAACRPG